MQLFRIPDVLCKAQPALFLLSLSLGLVLISQMGFMTQVLGRSVGEASEGCANAACTKCLPCFTGDKCTTKTLTIDNKDQRIPLNPNSRNYQQLFTKNDDNCNLIYEVQSGSEPANSMFKVEEGSVQLVDAAPGDYVVNITVRHPDVTKPYATVIGIEVVVEKILSRQRRAVVNPPGNVTFTMKRTFPVQNITYMTYGQRVSFEVTIAFPNKMTDMSVELFAPDNETEVMMLCNWDISIGAQLNILKADVVNNAKLEGRGSSVWPFTRIVLKLGNVTLKNPTGAIAGDFEVKITFDSIMIKTDVAISNNSKHWVSAGAEFDNETQIWIGSSQFIAVVDPDTTSYSPNVEFITPPEILRGTTNGFTLDMYLPQRIISPMTLDIIAPINNTEIISMCTAYITDVKESYKCIQKDKVSKAYKKYPYHQSYYKVSLDFGLVVNKESFNTARPNTSDHIVVTFYMRVNSSAAVGASTYIGAGIQMGPTMIWSGAKFFTIGADKKIANLTSPTSVTYNHKSSGPLSKHQLTFTDIKIATPMNSTTDVTVSAISPTGTPMIPKFHICSIVAVHVGRNYPCAKYLIGTNEMPITHKSTQPTATHVTDHLTLSMPSLRNTGLFTTNTSDNDMILRVFYAPSNNTNNVAANNGKIDFKVVWGGGQSTEQHTISFANDVNVSNLPNSSLPTFTFVNDGNTGTTVGHLEGRILKLSVQVKPEQMYAPATIELVLPYDTTLGAIYTVCQAEVETIGKALPCLRKTTINPSITFTSKANETTKNDRAVIPLGPVCSYQDSSFTPADYTFVILFRIYHQAVGAANREDWVSSGMLISSTQLWVGQVKFKTEATTNGDNTVPTLHLVRKDATNANIYKLDVARLRLIIKVPVAKEPKLTVTLTTNSTGGKLSICDVAVVSRGKCISCTGDNATYINFTNDRINRKQATIPLGKVLNTNCSNGAFYTHAGEDENSIVLEVVVKTDADIATKTSLVADVNYEAGSVKKGYHFDVVATPPPNGTVAKPTYKTSTVNLFNENETAVITNGEAVRFYLDVILAPYVKHYLDVNVGNRLGANILDIANVNVHSSGKNIPCIVPGFPLANASRRTGSPHQDFGQILIGGCLNTHQYESTDENNRIRIEVIVRVWKSISKTGATQVYSLAFLNQDYAQLTDGQVNYTYGQNISTYIQDPSISMNATVNLTDITIRPGSKFIVPLIVTVPPYTQYKRFLVDYKATDVDTTDSVTVTGSNMTFTYCGANLALFCNEPYYPTVNSSSKNSSQTDRMLEDLGILQNTAVTYRLNQVEVAYPDTFVVEYELQLTDNEAGYNGTAFWLSFGVSNGNQIVLVNKTVTVTRDGKETPILNYTASLENSTADVTYAAGMDIPMTILLSHHNTSSQEPRNCWLNLLHPPYLSVKSVVEPVTYIGTMNHSKITSGNYRFDFPWLFFTDYITVNFTMEVVAGAVIPGNRIESVTVVIAELVFDVFNRTGNANNYKWLRNATQVSLKVRGTPPTISSCNTNLNIHQTAEVKDCAISAFMSPFASFQPASVRTSTGWRSHVRSGQYAPHRYVTILFGKMKYVTVINLFSSTAAGVSKPTAIAVYKTMDGRAFTKVTERDVAWDSANNASFSLGKKVLMAGIRVAATKADNEDNTVSMQMEMYGCPHTDTTQHFDPCTTKEYDALPTTPVTGHYLRGFLHTGKFLFYCDYVPKKGTSFGITSRCFKAQDTAATTWTDLGPLVGSVIDYNDHGVAYAVSPDGMTHSMSMDHGDTWFAVNKGKYENDKAKGMMKSATVIPWTTKAGFLPNLKGDKCTAYSSGPWNFCYEGIFHNNGTTPVVRWNDCC